MVNFCSPRNHSGEQSSVSFSMLTRDRVPTQEEPYHSPTLSLGQRQGFRFPMVGVDWNPCMIRLTEILQDLSKKNQWPRKGKS